MLSFTVMILGQPGVGKSSFLNNYMGKRFHSEIPATIGVEFEHKDVPATQLSDIEKELKTNYQLDRWLWKKGFPSDYQYEHQNDDFSDLEIDYFVNNTEEEKILIENDNSLREKTNKEKINKDKNKFRNKNKNQRKNEGEDIYQEYMDWVKKYMRSSSNTNDYRYIRGDKQKDTISLKIWNSAGQDKFRSIVASYFRKTEAIVFVYDLTEPNSLENIVTWMEDFKKGYGPGNDNSNDNESPWMGLPAILVGNKLDLVEDSVSQERIDEICYKYNMLDFKLSSKVPVNPQIQFCMNSLLYLLMRNFLYTKGFKMIYGHHLNDGSFKIKRENGSVRRKFPFSCC